MFFEPFYRGSVQPPHPISSTSPTSSTYAPTSPPRGSGIGLAIVREQVTAHGGRVLLMADAGGACFRLLIPLDNDHA